MMDSLPGIRMSGENNDLFEENVCPFFQPTFDSNFLAGIGTKTAFGRNEITEGSISCILQYTIELITPPDIIIKKGKKNHGHWLQDNPIPHALDFTLNAPTVKHSKKTSPPERGVAVV
jgi:hypothetical protein